MSEKNQPRLLDLTSGLYRFFLGKENGTYGLIDGLYFMVLGMNMLKGLTRQGMFPAEFNAEHSVKGSWVRLKP